ncbi:glycosyltransferase family 4 protein [Paraburkholderia sediminicola]|uniref:glycosyltransferase family 4 protein n=1 Tax=Paraburkholderia sediminicola TaxID=458836 RepID=UPI0038BA80A1
MNSGTSARRATLLLVGASWSHLGSHSGLAPLSRTLDESFEVVRVAPKWHDKVKLLAWQIRQSIRTHLFGRPKKKGWSPFYSRSGRLLEIAARRMATERQFDVVFFEALEDHFNTFSAARKWLPRTTRIAGVSHQPPAWWRVAGVAHNVYKSVDTVIALSRDAAAFHARELGHENTCFVPHGVDFDFFGASGSRPESAADAAIDVLFCGMWLRDFRMLRETIDELDSRGTLSRFRFHLVVPLLARVTEHHYAVARLNNVTWYSALTDAELRGMYLRCHILFLPLIDATANNTLLEAMACGIPMVVSKVGGVVDYLNEDECTYMSGNSGSQGADCLTWSVEHYGECVTKAERAKQRCSRTLAWDRVGPTMAYLASGKGRINESPTQCLDEATSGAPRCEG